MIDELRSRVKRLTTSKGLTQLDVERAVGMSHSAYSEMWVRGTLTLDRMQAMATLFDVELVDLLRDPEPGKLSVVKETAPRYGKGAYLEDRVDRLETEVRVLKEQLRKR